MRSLGVKQLDKLGAIDGVHIGEDGARQDAVLEKLGDLIDARAVGGEVALAIGPKHVLDAINVFHLSAFLFGQAGL